MGIRTRIGLGLAVLTAAATGVGVYLGTRDDFVSQTSYSDDISGAVVSADGRTVTAIVPSQSLGVFENDTEDLAVSVTGTTVQIRIRIRTIKPVQRCCPGTAAQWGDLSAKLPTPFWGHTVVDGTGRAIPFFDGHKLLVPAGSQWKIFSTVPEPGRGGALAGASETFFVHKTDPSNYILTEWYAGSETGAPPADAVKVQVRGVMGEADGGLWWSENGLTMRLTTDGQQVATQDLVAFADALR